MTLPFHPAADLFPVMSIAELQALMKDIRVNGQREPVITYRGTILDGRSRWLACQTLGVSLNTIELMSDIESPVSYVVGKNLPHKHLNASQRAAIAAEAAGLLKQEPAYQAVATRYSPSRTAGRIRRMAREAAAKLLKVGSTSVLRAERIRDHSPEDFERVRRGEVTAYEVDPANPVNIGGVQVRTEKKPEPKIKRKMEPPRIDTRRGKQRAESHKRKMIDGLSLIGGTCHGLFGLDLSVISAVSTAAELLTWADKASDHSKDLRLFAATLRKGEQ